jgi:hypothetical protein
MSIFSRHARALAPLLLVGGATLASYVGCIRTDPCLRNSDCTHGERCIEGACAVPATEEPASDATIDDGDAAAETSDADAETGTNDADAGADADAHTDADADTSDSQETTTDGALDETTDADESG